MIDKVYYINIYYRIDKHYAEQAACAFVGVPGDRVERFPAPIGNKTAFTHADLGEKMRADGFPEWGEYYENVPDDYHKHPTWVAGIWAKLRLLRTVEERNETAICLSDTIYLCDMYFPSFEVNVGLLTPELEILYLRHVANVTNPDAAVQATKVKRTKAVGIWSNYYGYGGGGVLFTAEGASKFLEFWRRNPGASYETVTFKHGLTDESALSGVYVCEPQVAQTMMHDCGYDFVRTDKANWYGEQYLPSNPYETYRPHIPDGL